MEFSKMNVLVACEESQRVCIEFRRLGHRAFSCDLIPCSGGKPQWHIKDDVLKVINGDCTFKNSTPPLYLSNKCSFKMPLTKKDAYGKYK